VGSGFDWIALTFTSGFVETDPGSFNNTVAEKQVSSSRYVLLLICNKKNLCFYAYYGTF
jgi:hypothetical protein